MCIAIGKPMGIDVPSEEILENCWNNNDDGAGFAFNLSNRVVIKKGFMKYKDFIEAFRFYDKKYNFKNRGLLIHFRIATHGARDASMTHPFPIVDDIGALKKIEYNSNYAVIHNGIISLTSDYMLSQKTGLSDTALFIKDYLTKLAENRNWFYNKSNFELIEKLIDSKMAILDKNGNIGITSGFTKDNGVYYSNNTYKENRVKCNYNNYYYYYDNYYDDYDYYDSLAAKMDDSRDKDTSNTSSTGNIVALMRLRKGWYVECNEYSDQVNDDEVEYYIDSHNNLYISYSEKYMKNKMYYYMGECTVYDQNLTEISFKRDIWVNEAQLDSYDYDSYSYEDVDDQR